MDRQKEIEKLIQEQMQDALETGDLLPHDFYSAEFLDERMRAYPDGGTFCVYHPSHGPRALHDGSSDPYGEDSW